MSEVKVRLSGAGPLGPEEFVTHTSSRLPLVCRATVEESSASKRVTLFLQADGQHVSDAGGWMAPVLTAEAAGSVGALVRDSAVGHVTVGLGSEHAAHNSAVAAAVAVLRASWGWDESQTIVVAVNATPIRVALRDITRRRCCRRVYGTGFARTY